MKALAVSAVLLALCACAANKAEGHGAISVRVRNDPVLATLGEQNQYHFPLEMIVRETGGHPVQIARVSIKMSSASSPRTSGGSARWNADQLRALGAPTTIPANGEVILNLGPVRASGGPNPRVPPDGISAQIVVQALDETYTESQAWVAMTIVTH